MPLLAMFGIFPANVMDGTTPTVEGYGSAGLMSGELALATRPIGVLITAPELYA